MKPFSKLDLVLMIGGPFILRPFYKDGMDYLEAVFIYGVLLAIGKYHIIPMIYGSNDEDRN